MISLNQVIAITYIFLLILVILMFFKKIRSKWNRFAKRHYPLPLIYLIPNNMKNFVLGVTSGYWIIILFQPNPSLNSKIGGFILIIVILLVIFSYKTNKENICIECGRGFRSKRKK